MHLTVMPGLVPGIHVLLSVERRKTWMAGTGPAMTAEVPQCSSRQMPRASCAGRSEIEKSTDSLLALCA
jgi:hypothetical protein